MPGASGAGEIANEAKKARWNDAEDEASMGDAGAVGGEEDEQTAPPGAASDEAQGGGGRGAPSAGIGAGGGVGGRRVLQVQRTRSSERGGAGRPAMRAELEEFRAACKLDTQKMLAGHTRDVEHLIESQTERITRIVEPLMESVAETNERVSKLELAQDDAAAQIQELAGKVAALTTQLASVGASSQDAAATIANTVHEVTTIKKEIAFAVAGAPAPPPLAPDAIADYDRTPDAAKLRVNVSRPVDREVAHKFIQDLSEEAGLREDQWQLLPSRPLSKQFVVQCVGERRAAARRVALFLGTRRSAGGEWRKLHVVDPVGQQANVYLDPDRNGRQLKAEAALRRVVRAVKKVAGDLQAYPNYAEGIVTRNWRPIAKVEPGEFGETVTVLWNDAALVSLGLRKEAIKEELEAAAGERAEAVAWSS